MSSKKKLDLEKLKNKRRKQNLLSNISNYPIFVFEGTADPKYVNIF